MTKVAVVTGSAHGLGRELALFFARDGYAVVCHYNASKKEAKDLLAEVLEVSPLSMIVSADLTDEKQVKNMFAEVFTKFARIDVLVNNVGNFLYKKFGETTNNEFRNVLESNIYSTLFCSREVLFVMRKQKSGQIINIGSVGADRFTLRENSIPYFLAKNAVYILTKAMAWEEASCGIHINMVSPASMKTDIFKKGDFPMGRETKYGDVCGAVKFLLSKDAYYINGVNLEVAGAFVPGMR